MIYFTGLLSIQLIIFTLIVINKFKSYLKAAKIQGSLNLKGFPGLPKQLCKSLPYNRQAYNGFFPWIERLQLSDVKQVIDVGANHGDFSQAASSLFPSSLVLLVEPLPTLHKELGERCAERNGRWDLAKCALSDSEGTATLHVDPQFDAIGSLAEFSEEYRRANPISQDSKSFECEVNTLDQLCLSRGISAVDLLKIDVEGFEWEVLQGATRAIGATQSLIVEISLIRRPEESDPLGRLLRFLREQGFRLVDVLPSHFDPERSWLPLEFNVLARRE